MAKPEDGKDVADGDCREIPGDLLADFLDGRLDPAAAARIEEHLASCAGCSRRRSGLAGLLPALRAGKGALADVPIPEEVDRAIGALALKAAPAQAAPARIPFAYVAAAAVAASVLFVAGFALGTSELLNSAAAPAATGIERDDAPGAGGLVAREIEAIAARHAEETAMLKALIDTERRRADGTAVLLKSALEEARVLKTGMDFLEAEVGRQKRNIAGLAADLANASATRDQFASALAEKEASIESLRRQVSAYGETVSLLESEVSSTRDLALELQKKAESIAGERHAHGDVNRDGRTDSGDALAICGMLSKGGEVSFNPEFDMNGDGVIDVGDALMITGFQFSEK